MQRRQSRGGGERHAALVWHASFAVPGMLTVTTRTTKIPLWATLGASIALLAGCGGGGGDNPSGTAPTVSYAASATVTGLQGTLRLATLIGAEVPVAADGTVPLGSALSGTTYGVTVAQQPAGQRCEVNNGSGVLRANTSNIEVRCLTLLTAPSRVLRAGDLARLSGAPAATAQKALPATLRGQTAVTLTQDAGTLSFVVPPVPAGEQLLTVYIDGRGYEFGFELGPRAAAATPPAQVINATGDRLLQSLGALEVSGDPDQVAAAASLRPQVDQALAQLRALSAADQIVVANFFETIDAALRQAQAGGTGVKAPTKFNKIGEFAYTCPTLEEKVVFLANIAMAGALASAVPYSTVFPVLTGAIFVYQVQTAVQTLDFIKAYTRASCFRHTRLYNFFSTPVPTAAAAAPGTARVLSMRRATTPPVAERPVAARHDEPFVLRVFSDTELQADLGPSAVVTQKLLIVAGFLLPSSWATALSAWLPSQQQEVLLSRFRLDGASSPNVAFKELGEDAQGRLRLRLAYMPGLVPSAPETFDLLFTDPTGGTHKASVTLGIPELPTFVPTQFAVAEDGTGSGTLQAPEATGYRVTVVPERGVLTLAKDGSGRFTYVGQPGAVGPDSFTVEAFNDRGKTAEVRMLLVPRLVTIDAVSTRYVFTEGPGTLAPTRWFSVTVQGRAGSEVGQGWLLVSLDPSNGWQNNGGTASLVCSGWSGAYVYQLTPSFVPQRYCVRAPGDPVTTTYTFTIYMTESTLQTSNPRTGANIVELDPDFCAAYTDKLLCESPVVRGPSP